MAIAPQPCTLTDEQKAERDRMLLEWDATKQQIAKLVEVEMEQRKTCSAFLFPDPVAGTQRQELGNGYAVKLVHTVNYKLDTDLEKIDATLDLIEKCGNEGKFLGDRLVKWKAELSVTEYKALDLTNPTHAAVKKLIDGVLETKAGAPTLAIEPPKAKKA